MRRGWWTLRFDAGHLQDRYVERSIERGDRLAVSAVVHLRTKEHSAFVAILLHTLVNFRPCLIQTTNGEMVESSNDC